MIYFTTGSVLITEAALLLLPFLVSIIYRETCAWAFLITIGITLAVGGLICLTMRPKDRTLFSKEGLVIVALAWIAVSFFGALPFVISREIPVFIDAFFETVSGFTTTGATILDNVEIMSHGLLFWRSFTHWIGGMGVLVFVMAVTVRVPERSIHILRAEMPGPIVDKLVPRARTTAMILYIIYIAMTALEVIFLLAGGMPFFDSLVHSFGTAGTGGFGIRNGSIASYSPYLQWVIAVFMFLFAINFNLYYLMLLRKFSSALRSTELWVYIGIMLGATGLICYNIFSLCSGFAEALRLSFFQASSIMTTTGYTTANISLWPTLSKAILLTLMLIGGCAGSTAGGFKVSRVVILFKSLVGRLRRVLHPRTVTVVKMEGKRIDDDTLSGVHSYLALCTLSTVLVFLLLCLEKDSVFTIETNLSAAITCFNNIGPLFSQMLSSFSAYSGFSKFVLSVAMLLGRLEIYPLLLTCLPSTWLKK